MVSRRDDLRVHRLRMRRVTAAVLTGRADVSVMAPRTGTAALIGGSVTAAALATVALYAVLTGGSAWRHGGSVIVEKETGTRLVLVNGVLHPVLNYASARLVVGSADPPIAVVPHATLASTAHGPRIGIAGAPDVIPATSALDTASWTVCSLSSPAAAVVFAGAGGNGPVSGGRALGASALPVTDPDGDAYLISGLRRAHVVGKTAVFGAMLWPDVPSVAVGGAGRCFPIADAGALASLGYASAPVVAMPASVVAPVPQGPMLSRAAALRSAPDSEGDHSK